LRWLVLVGLLRRRGVQRVRRVARWNDVLAQVVLVHLAVSSAWFRQVDRGRVGGR